MKRKLLLAALCVVSALGLRAQDPVAPFLNEKDDFGGTTVSSLTTFCPTGTTYTLEVTGTADTEITVPGGSFSYTPTTSGTVRFVRNGGDVVYVYEGTTYKGTVAVSAPADPTYPTGLTSGSAGNIIQNGGFEDTSDGTYTSGRYKPTKWTPYNNSKSAPSNGTSVRPGSELTGSYNMLMHTDGYYLTQQLVSGVMKSFTPYQISYNYRANQANQAGSKYKFQVGSEQFKSDYFSSNENNAGTTSLQTFSTTFTTPAVVDQPYVQLYRSTYGYGNSNQGIDRFDEFILVAANGGGIGITGVSAATCLLGKAYAPEGVLAANLPVDATSRVTNPTFDTDLTGWNSPIGGGSEIKVADNRQDQTRNFYQTWNGTPREGRMYQVIEGLPQGTYELKMIAFADQAATMNLANTTVAVYAQGQEVGTTSSSYIRPNYIGSADFTEYKAYAYVDATGKLEIGMRQYSPAQFRWLGMDNVTLKYVATDNQEVAKMLELYQEKWNAIKTGFNAVLLNAEYEGVLGKERTDLTNALSATVSSYDDYKTVADAAKNAYLTFIGAKDAYATCATEYSHYTELSGTATYVSFITGTTTADDVLKAIKEAEYTAVTTTYITDGSALFIPSWTVTNFDELDEQHWSGTARTYYDKWSGSAANSSISKTVTLPEGKYVFYAAGRGQANSSSSATLKVVYDETTLTQSYTMKGDTGYGIDTSGAANFSAEGTYANNNAGRGWEWRYIAFDLATETEVTLSIEGSFNNSWVSACDTKLLTYDNIAVSSSRYTTAKANATAALDNGDYAVVTGSERTELSGAIPAVDPTTRADYDTAADALETKLAAFTSAVSAYQALIDARAVVYEDNLTYASATKFAAIATAQAAAAATSAADATTKTNAIISAYRKYVESNALAEGVDGAVDKTNLIADPNFDGVSIVGTTAGGWTFDQSGGSANINSNEPLTDGAGSSSYSYFDYYNGSNNNQNIHQVIENLAPGRYILTATGRGHANFNGNLQLYVVGKGDVKIPAIGNSGGVFNRGWNDASLVFDQTTTSDVTIGARTTNGQAQWWGVTRFRLVKIADVAVMAVNSDAKYGTFCAPFDVTIPDGVTAYKVTGVTGNSLNLEEVSTTIPANKPVVLNAESGLSATTFYGKSVDGTPTNGLLTGVYESTPAPNGSYVLQNNDDKVGFYLVDTSVATPTVGTNRCYMTIGGGGSAKAFFFPGDDEATLIEGLDALTAGEYEAIYTMGGVKVNALQKGTNIVQLKSGKTLKINVK